MHLACYVLLQRHVHADGQRTVLAALLTTVEALERVVAVLMLVIERVNKVDDHGHCGLILLEILPTYRHLSGIWVRKVVH